MGGMQSVGMQQQQQPSTQPGFGQFNTRGSVPSQNYSGNMSGGFSGNPQSLQQLGNCSWIRTISSTDHHYWEVMLRCAGSHTNIYHMNYRLERERCFYHLELCLFLREKCTENYNDAGRPKKHVSRQYAYPILKYLNGITFYIIWLQTMITQVVIDIFTKLSGYVEHFYGNISTKFSLFFILKVLLLFQQL